MKHRLVLLYILIWFGLPGCASTGGSDIDPMSATAAAGDAERSSESPAVSDDTYTVAPGDILEISVWKEEDLDRKVLVAPDGRLNFPMVGTIDARDKSVAKIRKEIEQRLKPYITEPVVNVAVINNQGNSIFVIGKVEHPGQYAVRRNIDVLQALSLAGGLTPFAEEDDIKILRRVGAEVKVFPFDYSEVVSGENLQQNILLKPGDTVTVP